MRFEWSANAIPKDGENLLFATIDFDKYRSAIDAYEQLSREEKKNYKGKDQYIEKVYGITISTLQNDYLKLREELDKRLGCNDKTEFFKLGKLTGDNILFELLASIENETYIKDMYKLKKKKVSSSGINQKEAGILIDCMRQGRSLLEAGRKADILAKPLIDFYAATAYTYAIIVLNSPLHKSIDSLKSSHGHTYSHEKGTIEFGCSVSKGTFLDMMCAVFYNTVSFRDTEITYSLLDSIDFLQKNYISLSLKTLLSMVPEIHKFYEGIDISHYSTHKLAFDHSVSNNGDVCYNFYIGDGVHVPNLDLLRGCFNTDKIKNCNASYQVSISGCDLRKITPMIYQDICGELWYVETPIMGLNIPEICLHYLIISALGNIMRYSPQDWNRIINSKESAELAMLVRRYLWLFEIKFPMLVVRYLTNYLPVCSSELL